MCHMLDGSEPVSISCTPCAVSVLDAHDVQCHSVAKLSCCFRVDVRQTCSSVDE
jgi:hypothetical protein